MRFEILGEISQIETFATGSAIREIARLRRIYGRARWRKRKGVARIRLADGSLSISQSCIGTKQAALGAKNSRSRTSSEVNNMIRKKTGNLVVCINNEGYAVSLEKRKIYLALRDEQAEKRGLLRIIDESGEDYLYPKTFFRSIALPQSIKKAVLAAA
jgi:hypothetical protein